MKSLSARLNRIVLATGAAAFAVALSSVLVLSAGEGRLMLAVVCASASGCTTIFVGYWLMRGLLGDFAKMVRGLSNGAGGLSELSSQLLKSGADLSKGAAEQTSALQHTVSSLDEVNLMINQTAENASLSHLKASESEDIVTRGQHLVGEMVKSIDEIDFNHGQVVAEIDANFEKIAEIAKLISAIGDKTKVINDIVFQTKLLSYNASVEAARAGEHGKGFAVVAEEIGKLAQKSGSASREIQDLLQLSLKQVGVIVSTMETRVKVIAVEGRTKVEKGLLSAKTCNDAFAEIFTSMVDITKMVQEISTAANEQALGVSAISKAMVQLDEVARSNSEIAISAVLTGESLREQAFTLERTIKNLTDAVAATPAQAPRARRPSPKPALTKTNVIALAPRRQSVAPTTPFATELPSAKDPRFEDG